MGPLLSLTGALLVATTPPRPCYLPSDQTAGWKRVELPAEAPSLAPPTDIEQFRSGEIAHIHEEDPRDTYLGAFKRHSGRMSYNFRVPKGTIGLGVDFLDSLDGAKVDATAYVGGRAYPLLSGRRHSGRQFAIDWDVRDVDTVVVEVHHHLREEPVVRHWRVSRDVILSREASVSASFQAARSLYFLNPGGRRIELCDRPEQRLWLSRTPEGAPVTVTLTRAGTETP